MTRDEIEELIAANLAAKAEYERLVDDELVDRGSPSGVSEAELVACEEVLGQRLPESYRQFLQVRDGLQYFDGDSHLLSLAALMQGWVREECAMKAELFAEFEDDNPFRHGALPVVIGEDSNAMLLWERGDGGVFVEYDIVERIEEYASLFDYIREDTRIVGKMVEKEAGVAE